jgi:hypothetical protein
VKTRPHQQVVVDWARAPRRRPQWPMGRVPRDQDPTAERVPDRLDWVEPEPELTGTFRAAIDRNRLGE